MRGAVLHAPGDVRVEERENPAIVEPTDAIIRVSAACVCGSDLWPYRGIEPVDRPAPMGHEYAGVVEEVGTDVTTTDWFQTMTASHIDGSAVVEYSALQEASGIPVSYAGDGRIRIETTTTLFGARVVAQITGVPRLDRSQAITLGDPTITVASVELPDFTAEAMLRTVLKPIPVTGLPLGLTLSSIAADPSAMRFGLVGDNVPLQG